MGITDPGEFYAYLDRNPDFVAACAGEIRVVDVNASALELHGFATRKAFIDTVTQNFTEKHLRAIRGGIEAIHAGKTLVGVRIDHHPQRRHEPHRHGPLDRAAQQRGDLCPHPTDVHGHH